MKINFQLPSEVTISGQVITQSGLRSALRTEDYSVLRPVIDSVLNTQGDERENFFNFFLGGIQFGVEHCVRQSFGYFDKEIQEEIFWQGVAYVWQNLSEFDEGKSKLMTWIWNQVRYGSRDARRKEISAKRLLARCENNPALLAEEILYSAKRSGNDRSFSMAGTPVATIAGSLGRELNELSKQETNALRESVNSLRENDRRLIVMRVVDQLEIEEIAKLLGDEVTNNQVYVAYSRAIKRLREQYAKKLIEERAKEV